MNDRLTTFEILSCKVTDRLTHLPNVAFKRYRPCLCEMRLHRRAGTGAGDRRYARSPPSAYLSVWMCFFLPEATNFYMFSSVLYRIFNAYNTMKVFFMI